MVYLPGNGAALAVDHRSARFHARLPRCFFFFKSKLNTGVHSYPKTKKLISDERTEFLNARNAKIRKKFCSMDVIFSLKGICNNKKKKSVYILKRCREKCGSLEESLSRT